MNLGDLYQFVIVLILIGFVVGLGIVVLDKFMGTTGLSSTAVAAINNTIVAIAEIPNTWLGLLVTAVVVILILGLIVGGLMRFGMGRNR